MSQNNIRLVIADLDGTLLDPQKKLTAASIRAVRELEAAGILFTIVSGRPSFGMRMYVDALQISLPIGGFNGGEIMTPHFLTLQRYSLAAEVSHEAARFFDS